MVVVTDPQSGTSGAYSRWRDLAETSRRAKAGESNAEIGKSVAMSLAGWRPQTAVNLDGVFLSVSIDPHELARAGVPLGRAGRAQDIANGVTSLASDVFSYITGAKLVIDAGITGGARPRWWLTTGVREASISLCEVRL